MLGKLFSWFRAELIYKKKVFGIALDEEVLLRAVADLKMKFFPRMGILMLTSKRLAFRSLDTVGLRPSWLGGKRTALDIPIRDIASVTSGKKRVSPFDLVRLKILIVHLKERDEPYTFVTPDSEIWRERIDEVRTRNGIG